MIVITLIEWIFIHFIKNKVLINYKDDYNIKYEE